MVLSYYLLGYFHCSINECFFCLVDAGILGESFSMCLLDLRPQTFYAVELTRLWSLKEHFKRLLELWQQSAM